MTRNDDAAARSVSEPSRAPRETIRPARDDGSREELALFPLARGLLGWRFGYRDRAPRPSPRWVSSGLEISVQLHGRWRHAGRWGGAHVVAPGECLFLSPGEPYSHTRSIDPGEEGLQVGFLLLRHEHPSWSEIDGELRWGRGGARERRLVELAHYVSDAIASGLRPNADVIETTLAESIARRCELQPPDGLVRAKQEIERCFSRPLYMRHFADLAGVREAVFSRQFTARFGQTPLRYRLHLRVNAAARLLDLQTGESVRDIARRAGFEDESFFFRTFRALVGTTPLRYAARRRAPLAITSESGANRSR